VPQTCESKAVRPDVHAIDRKLPKYDRSSAQLHFGVELDRVAPRGPDQQGDMVAFGQLLIDFEDETTAPSHV